METMDPTAPAYSEVYRIIIHRKITVRMIMIRIIRIIIIIRRRRIRIRIRIMIAIDRGDEYD